MERDKALENNERHTCSITADLMVGSGGGASTCAPSIARMPASRIRILFAIALVAIILAFSSGPTFVGMFFALVSIGCFGYGFGSIMDSPQR